MRLPYGVCPAGDMSRKNRKNIEELPNIFGIADDILVVGCDDESPDYDRILCRLLQICRKENLKLNKVKHHFMCTIIDIFGEIIFKYGIKPDPTRCVH